MKNTGKKLLKVVVVGGAIVGIVAIIKKICDKRPAYEDDFEDEFEDDESIYANDDFCEGNCECKQEENDKQSNIKANEATTETTVV